jgi:hypothetical protein
MKGHAHLRHFCLQNRYLHATIAYNMHRHRGIETSKRDFLATF